MIQLLLVVMNLNIWQWLKIYQDFSYVQGSSLKPSRFLLEAGLKIKKPVFEGFKNTYINSYNNNLYKNTKKRFLVTSAYKSYDVLNLEENTSQAGYSEFQLGTSVSLKVNGIKDVEFVSTDVYQWLLEHSYEYGYVLRYPSDKVTITQKESCNIFRYVGKENAQKMHNQNLCLEELNNQ